MRKALEDANEWSNRNEQAEQRSSQPGTRISCEKWIPPLRDWVKCNLDGARQVDGFQSGTGWVLREKDEQFCTRSGVGSNEMGNS